MGATKVRNEQITSEAAGDGQVLTADGAGVAAWEAVPAMANHDHSGDAGDGGTFDAANLTAGASGDGQVLTSDGVGGAAWENPPAAAAHNHTTADGSGVLTNDEHDGYSNYIAIATPASPAAGAVRLYAKAKKMTQVDEDGLETDLTAGGGVATDAIWDAAGDIVQGTGANTGARLAIGTAFQVLQANSGATANIFGPALTDWTPVFVQGNQTPAKTINYAKYIRLGTLCIAWANVSFTAAGQAANAIVLTGFPESTLMTTQIVGMAHVYDASGTWYVADCVYIPAATDSIQFVCNAATGSLGVNPAYTIANTDGFSVFLMYPI